MLEFAESKWPNYLLVIKNTRVIKKRKKVLVKNFIKKKYKNYF